MRTLTILILALAFFPACALAQGHGTAPLFFPPRNHTDLRGDNGYYDFCAANLYPVSYLGDIWTGTVTAVRGRKVSLAWNKNGKMESFTGQVVASYYVPTAHYWDMAYKTQLISVAPPSPSLIGQKVRVYYVKQTYKVKVNGRKVKVKTDSIFRLDPQ